MSRDELLKDLDYVKAMAEEGANTPLLGGRVGLMWGFLLVPTLMLNWAILSGKLEENIFNVGVIWFIFGITGGILSALLSRTLGRKPGCKSVINRVDQANWTGTTIMIFTLAISIAFAVTRNGQPSLLFDIIMAIAFAAYFMNYFALAQMSQNKYLFIPAFISLAAMVVIVNLLGNPLANLVAIVGVIFTVIIPSLISMKLEPSDVV